MIEKICWLLLINLLFFLKTLSYKYCSDDVLAYQREKEKVRWKRWLYLLEGRARSVPMYDHLLTLLIHAINAVLVYLAFGVNNVSFLAAILFSINPATNQASVWIAGRAYALSATGLLICVVFPWIFPLGIALATYYNAGFFGVVTLLGSPYPWMFLLAPLAWWFHYKRFKKNVMDRFTTESFPEDRKIHIGRLIVVIKTFGFYTTLALVPFKNTFYHSYMQSMAGSLKHKAYTLKDRFFWLGLAFGFSALGYMIFHPWDRTNFAVLWWCICIAPYLNGVRMQQEIAERFMYLPLPGLMFILALFLINYPPVAAFFIGLYATKLWFYMDSYQDDFYLCEFSCLYSPQSWFAWHIRGVMRWNNQSYREAVILWVMAHMLNRKEFKVLVNLSSALMVMQNKKEADEYMKMAMDNVPEGQEKMANEIYENYKKGNGAIVL